MSVRVCAICMGVLKDQKRESDLMELELEAVVSSPV